MEDVTINIEGPAASGKSTIALLIKEMAELQGFKVNMKLDVGEKIVDATQLSNGRIGSVASKTKLNIVEKQIRRA